MFAGKTEVGKARDADLNRPPELRGCRVSDRVVAKVDGSGLLTKDNANKKKKIRTGNYMVVWIDYRRSGPILFHLQKFVCFFFSFFLSQGQAKLS